jgi:hypothetical protein
MRLVESAEALDPASELIRRAVLGAIPAGRMRDRLRGNWRGGRGRLLGVAAGVVAFADGYVAGHMSHVRLVATGELGTRSVAR